MSFLYVDRVSLYEPWRVIRGTKTVTRTEPFLYTMPDGRRLVSPAVLSEAPAQFGAWLVAASTDFEKRSVFLRDERTRYPVIVQPGSILDVEVIVLDRDDDVLWTRGSVRVDGVEVMVSERSAGYLVPLAEYSDPNEDRLTFDRLRADPGKPPSLTTPPNFQPTPAACLSFGPPNPTRFIDGILEHKPGQRVVALKNFSRAESYFADHFPRKPIVPGVLLSTCVAEAAQFLLWPNVEHRPDHVGLLPVEVADTRFRRFVEPGDQCVICLDVISGDCSQQGDTVTTKVTMSCGKSRVMQAQFSFTPVSR